MAAAAIAAAAGPCHDPPTSSAVTDPKDAAAELNSSARLAQAVAAAKSGSDPAPANTNAELISGGNTKKLIAQPFLTPRHASDSS
ncbi:hypothetical protein LRC484719_13900 [Mycobacterium riyadhense]